MKSSDLVFIGIKGTVVALNRPSPNKADFENLIRMDDAMENGFLLLRSTYLC